MRQCAFTFRKASGFYCRLAVAVSVAAALCCWREAQASMVAHWRFEGGPAGAVLSDTAPAMDSSGNGCHLYPLTEGGISGFEYCREVAVGATGGADNYFSVKCTGTQPNLTTDSDAAIRMFVMPAFTIEVLFKPALSGHRTLVGRDSYGMVSYHPALAALYLKIKPDNSVAIEFADVSGYWHTAQSAADLIQGFDPAANPDGIGTPWYYVVAVSDGSVLSLYLSDVSAGEELRLVARVDMRSSGSPDCSVSAGQGAGDNWIAGNWSVGRGLYNGQIVDYMRGFIDEVRISDTALVQTDYLLSELGPSIRSNISWDSASNRTVYTAPAGRGVWYPRLLKLSSGHWLCAFDTNAFSSSAEVWISQSVDGGQNWNLLSKASFGSGNAANGQLTELSNGDILCAYRLVNEPSKAIKVSRSSDRGQTWQDMSTVISNTAGVWEPHILRKPNGQLLLFYAQEAGTAYQVVEMQRSDDNGQSWSRRQTVAAGTGSRDGMSVPAILHNGHIAVAIEGWVAPYNSRMGIWMVRSSNGGDTWGPREPIYLPEAGITTGAPYLVAMPTGELVLSYQETRAAGCVEMKVLVSTDDGASWALQNDPFGDGESWWNATAIVNPTSLFAVTSVGRTIRIVNGSLYGPGDFNNSGFVDISDFSLWTEQWLFPCAESDQWCNGSDLNRDGRTDLSDMSLFGWFWLN